MNVHVIALAWQQFPASGASRSSEECKVQTGVQARAVFHGSDSSS